MPSRHRSLTITKQMSLRDLLHDDQQELQHKSISDNDNKDDDEDATEADSCLAQSGTDVARPLHPQPNKALSRRHLQRSGSIRKIGRRRGGVGSTSDMPDLRRSLSRTSCVIGAENEEASELVQEEHDTFSSPRKSFRKVESQKRLLSKPDFRRSASQTSCAVVETGSSEFLDLEETAPVSPSKATRTKQASARKSLRKANSQKGLNKPELRRSSSKTIRSTAGTEGDCETSSSPRKASLSRQGSSRAMPPAKSLRKSSSQRIKSQGASLRRSNSSRNCDKEWSGDGASPTKQQQPRKQGSMRNANFQRTKSDFRRSHSTSMPPAPPLDNDHGENYFADMPTNRLFLRSSSSEDFGLKENEYPARSGQRQRQEGIDKVDWKKEVLKEVEPDEAEAKDTKTATPHAGVKALAKVANLFSSRQELGATVG